MRAMIGWKSLDQDLFDSVFSVSNMMSVDGTLSWLVSQVKRPRKGVGAKLREI